MEVSQTDFEIIKQEPPNMKYQISLGKCVMLVLGCYLAFVIFRANNKLQLDKIGTIFSTVSEKTVQAGNSPLLHKYILTAETNEH